MAHELEERAKREQELGGIQVCACCVCVCVCVCVCMERRVQCRWLMQPNGVRGAGGGLAGATERPSQPFSCARKRQRKPHRRADALVGGSPAFLVAEFARARAGACGRSDRRERELDVRRRGRRERRLGARVEEVLRQRLGRRVRRLPPLEVVLRAIGCCGDRRTGSRTTEGRGPRGRLRRIRQWSLWLVGYRSGAPNTQRQTAALATPR